MNETLEPGSRVAVVGGGAAGISAAHRLQRRYDVSLLEAAPHLGGHVYTVDVADNGGPVAVDMGFIVFNRRNYPLFCELLDELGVASQESDMSFGYSSDRGVEYAGTGWNGLFAQRRRIADPGYLRFLAGVVDFGRRARSALQRDELGDETLGEYLHAAGCGRRIVDDFIVPMGAAIWSSPRDGVLAFPARRFLHFFENHGLLALDDRPQWRTIVGGSRTWVEAFAGRFSGTVRTATPVLGVRSRPEGGVEVRTSDATERFEAVVVATHADQAARMLENPTPEQAEELGRWRYSDNPTVLHTDLSALPRNRRARASWNYYRNGAAGAEPVRVTYDMNRLQRLRAERRYLVTLNAPEASDPEHTLHATRFQHPLYDVASPRSQERLRTLGGVGSIWFCGAHLGDGFHEDAVRSGHDAARALGAEAE